MVSDLYSDTNAANWVVAATLSSVAITNALEYAFVIRFASFCAFLSLSISFGSIVYLVKRNLAIIKLLNLIKRKFTVLVSISHSETLSVDISVSHICVLSLHDKQEFIIIDEIVAVCVSSLEFLHVLLLLPFFCKSLDF